MFETKCTKALLKYISDNSSDKDGFYYGMDFQETSGFSVREVEATIVYLVCEGLLEQPFKGRPDIIKPTMYGLNYRSYRVYKLRQFIFESIICPIIVSVITTLITLYISGL